LSGFKRFFLRPARKPFWERETATETWPGVAALAVGGGCLAIAFTWWNSLTENPAGLVSSPAEGVDKIWSYSDAIFKTGLFWVVGAIATFIGAIQLLLVLTGKAAMGIAKRALPKKKKDG
jgi:hypothetical protein